MDALQTFAYIVASMLFIVGLQMLGKAETAKRGNRISALGMLVAIVATLYFEAGLDFTWIVVGLVVGGTIGAIAARRVQMTGMPEMVALLNGSGGLASLLVGWAEYVRADAIEPFPAFAIVLTVLIGGVAASGSLIAFAKLSGRMDGKPLLFPGQKVVNAGVLGLALLAGAVLVVDALLPAGLAAGLVVSAFAVVVIAALVLGVMAVLPIGGADMPIVVSLLNSYSGVAAAAAGFVIDNNVLVVAGSLVGASGLILTKIMCKAMNRSLANVLFGGFGATVSASGAVVEGEVKPLTPDDAYYILEAASSVVFVPGYGMAVAQAQHVVKELADQLDQGGRRGALRDPPRGRAHAGAHERAAGRGERPLRAARRARRRQPDDGDRRRRDRDRRQRRREPGRQGGPEQPALRHADHRGRPRAHVLRPQALDEPRASPAWTTRSSSRTTPA